MPAYRIDIPLVTPIFEPETEVQLDAIEIAAAIRVHLNEYVLRPQPQ